MVDGANNHFVGKCELKRLKKFCMTYFLLLLIDVCYRDSQGQATVFQHRYLPC